MDEEEVRQIIKEELRMLLGSTENFQPIWIELLKFIGIDRFLFQKNIQIFDNRNIQLGRTTGTKIGTAIDQKLGFFGTTPVDKPETIEDATDLETVIIVANTIIDRLQELGLIK